MPALGLWYNKKMNSGYIIALICSVFFSLYIVPKKLSKANPIIYTLFVGVGFAGASLISYVVVGLTTGKFDNLWHPAAIFSIMNGISWMIASVLFVTAIDRIGLSRSNQWKNLQGPVGALLCLFVLGEWMQTRLEFVLLAVATITISAYLFTIKKSDEKRVDTKSIGLAIGAAFLFGFNAMLQKLAINHGLETQAQQLYFSSFVFISAVVFVFFKYRNLKVLGQIKKKDNWLGILGGALFFFASLTSIISNHFIPASVAFTIIQFNAVWTVLIGVLIFKEIEWRKHWLRLLAGIVLAIVSIVLLVMAKP
ncbi:GRP family sugar transporter [Candidatus Saccharibacteria bacterium]|nr:GRP family sugar transporter [Candidatus Saccharibacteria bacterium]